MKRLFGMALIFVLGAGVAQAGGIGGLGGAGLTIHYDSSTRTLFIPGYLNERFEIRRHDVGPDSGVTSYSMETGEFACLQEALDSRQVINARNENGGTRSYRAVSGDQPQQVELIDRRAAIRSEVK